MRHGRMGPAVSGAPNLFAINFEAASAVAPGAGARNDAKGRVVREVGIDKDSTTAHIVLACLASTL